MVPEKSSIEMYEFLESLPRAVKFAVLLSVDALLTPVCLYLAFALRYGTSTPMEALSQSTLMFPLLLALGIMTAIFLGLPKISVSSYELRGVYKSGAFAIAMTFLAIGLSYLLKFDTPRSVPLIFGVLLFLGSAGARVLAHAILQFSYDRCNTRKPVAIYGAGSAGSQLALALRRSKTKPVIFVDDNETLHGMELAGLPVQSPARLNDLIASKKIESVLLAIPSAMKEQRKRIIRSLGQLGVEVLALPTYNEILSSNNLVESLRQVEPEELLGREKVDLDVPGVVTVYKDRTILVSGAGGSIGSELCRQLLGYQIRKLVLFEQSEFALYSIERELRPIAEARNIELVPVIGSACDPQRVTMAMQDHNVQVVVHAAAYKHVPLVEGNELEGLRNNVIGTKVLADASNKLGIERFIMISTDKAVRPTNIMGASKRLAEMVIQEVDTRSEKTKYSMVRFGNVLGSSGSVIPLFREQIAKGGPVTVTHEKVTRFFMTIPEASRLVLLAGGVAEGGDVLVLDMGKPINIMDLAKRMIRLSGRTVRDANNPNGDIEIATTGLRPGEKLYEELLVTDDLLPTPHPKILRARETCLSEIEIANAINALNIAISNGDADAGRKVVERWVHGYVRPRNASLA
jgi:FlaA1/EpsC-like NDP-sugar epimerase